MPNLLFYDVGDGLCGHTGGYRCFAKSGSLDKRKGAGKYYFLNQMTCQGLRVDSTES